MVDAEEYIQTDEGLWLYAKVVGRGHVELIVPGLPGDDELLAPLTLDRAVAFYHPRGRGLSDSITEVLDDRAKAPTRCSSRGARYTWS